MNRILNVKNLKIIYFSRCYILRYKIIIYLYIISINEKIIYYYIKSKSIDPTVILLTDELLYIFNCEDMIDHK